jgi:two-component system C4-dicarboxylate transport response regulator DctD
MKKVLLVDDDASVRDALGQTLELADLTPILARSVIEAKDHIGTDFDGIVVSDVRMPGKDGFDLLAHAQKIDKTLPVILLTGEGDIPMAVRGMEAGAFDFLEKPCAPTEFLAVVQRALKTRGLVQENRRLKQELQRGDAAARLLHGQSDLATELRQNVRKAGQSAAEVMVLGAPGSGTAKVAEVIHMLSGAANRPFVKLAAAGASPDDIVAAFEKAHGGTLYLDDVFSLAPAAQLACLDQLDAGHGVRVIAGSYMDPDSDETKSRFSPDLFYRLDVMRIRIPALKERTEDIPILFRHYVDQAAEQANLPAPIVSQHTIANLMAREWPGNARALMNAAMRFVLGQGELDQATDTDLGLAEQMARVERSIIMTALERNNGNATLSARALQVPRKTFYDKLARHGLKPEDFRRSS